MEEFNRLIDIVKKLRSPEGCPWDREQTLYSMKSAMMEEASELLDALDNKDIENITEELGDLLLHVVIHSQIAAEDGLFSINDVAKGINEKLIRRHPHVFGNIIADNSETVMKNWEEIKKKEKADKPKPVSVLDKVPANMPTLMKAEKLQKRAAKFGFDWDNISDVFNKVDEELKELKDAVASGNKNHMSEELGDTIFALANVARHIGVDADESLRKTNTKFKRRFLYIEQNLEKQGKALENTSLDEMENLWQEAKKKE